LAGTTPAAVLKPYPGTTQISFACTIVQSNTKVRVYLSSPASKNLAAGDYIWNLQLTNNSTGDVKTYLAGDVVVYAEVDA